MLSSLRLESVAYRFQPFVCDLRSFLKESDVAYGFPEHLLSFTEKVSGATSLRAGVSAKLLEAIRGSQQPPFHGELVELLVVTVGGANIDEDTPAVQKAERVLSRLVGEVMTSREGVTWLEHPTPETPAIQHAPATESVVAFPVAEPEPAVRVEQPRPGAIVWASPPSFVWAALLCGVLLPPCMYFLSRPHAGQPTAPPSTTNASMHSAVRTRPALNPVLLPVYDPKPLDLDIDDSPAPKKRPTTSLSQPRVVLTADAPSPGDLSSALVPVDTTPSWTGKDTSPQETRHAGAGTRSSPTRARDTANSLKGYGNGCAPLGGCGQKEAFQNTSTSSQTTAPK